MKNCLGSFFMEPVYPTFLFPSTVNFLYTYLMPEGVEFDESPIINIDRQKAPKEPGLVRVLIKLGVIKKPSSGYMVLVIIIFACFIGAVGYYILGNNPKRVSPKVIPLRVIDNAAQQ
jgi:hypothetical protein